MASAGFMFVTASGSSISGESSVTSEGRENSIQIVEVQHDVLVPSDSMSGVSTGTRQHRTLRVTARVDKATPMMYQAWASNAPCEVQLRFWRPDRTGSGIETEYFQIELTGARVASVKMHWPNSLRADTAAIQEQVEYGFTYHTITWTFLTGGISFQDDWYSAPP
ncbi:MAG: Hcp family type VI secretion system effector [Rhodothermia bacterium]|nr:MAG: Hcp family type VI secretion system effector [Rhodothermia bacterium]